MVSIRTLKRGIRKMLHSLFCVFDMDACLKHLVLTLIEKVDMMEEWTMAKTKKKRIKGEDVGTDTKVRVPTRSKRRPKREDFPILVPRVPREKRRERRPMAQPKDSKPRDRIRTSVTRLDVLTAPRAMTLITEAMTWKTAMPRTGTEETRNHRVKARPK
jgi:hypothetical protein